MNNCFPRPVRSVIFNFVGFLALFGPALPNLKVQYIILTMLSALFVCTVIINPQKRFCWPLIAFPILIVCVSITGFLIVLEAELTGVFYVVKLVFFMFSAAGLIELLKLLGLEENGALGRRLYGWLVVDSMIPLSFFLFPELRAKAYEVLDILILQRGLKEGIYVGVRFTDLIMGGGTLSIIYFFGIVLAFFLYRKKYISIKWVIVGVLFLSIGIVLTGRIGILLFAISVTCVLVSMIVRFFLGNSRIKLHMKIGRHWLRLYSMTIIGFLTIIYLIFNINESYINEVLRPVIGFSFEFLMDSRETQFGSKSVDAMVHGHFKLSDFNLLSIVFGKGKKPDSDVGYINYLEIYGIIGVVLLLLMYLYIFLKILRPQNKRVEAKVLAVYFLFLLIINMKQFFFTNAGSGFFIIVLLVTFLLQQRSRWALIHSQWRG